MTDKTLVLALASLAALSSVASAAPHLKLGAPKATRGEKYITDFTLDQVAPQPDAVGVGGITAAHGYRIDGCHDDPGGKPSDAKGQTIAAGNNVAIIITDAVAAGKTGRGWAGTHCAFKLVDITDPNKWAELPLDKVPAFNAPTAIVRDGDRVYIDLNWNGYAKEAHGEGNIVVALDLAAHTELWRSKNMVSNGAMMLIDGSLVTGYGFTAEAHFLVVLDAATGKQLQKIDLPKSPGDMARKGDTLFVQIYDGYVALPIGHAG